MERSLLVVPVSYANFLIFATLRDFNLCPGHCDALVAFAIAFYLARNNRQGRGIAAFIFHTYCYTSIIGIGLDIEPLHSRPALLPWPSDYTPEQLLKELGNFLLDALFKRPTRPWNE